MLLAQLGATTSIRFDSGVEVWRYLTPGAGGTYGEYVVVLDPRGVVARVRRRAGGVPVAAEKIIETERNPQCLIVLVQANAHGCTYRTVLRRRHFPHQGLVGLRRFGAVRRRPRDRHRHRRPFGAPRKTPRRARPARRRRQGHAGPLHPARRRPGAAAVHGRRPSRRGALSRHHRQRHPRRHRRPPGPPVRLRRNGRAAAGPLARRAVARRSSTMPRSMSSAISTPC